MPGPLEGIRVVDLTTIYSGPMCTSILGDQGADVIKVESPQGDYVRTPGLVERNGVNAPFAMLNRNKRSIVIDLGTLDGREVLEKLVADADVLVENYRPGVMERLGLGFDSLKVLNPRLIFTSINGFGHQGPYASRRVYDAIIQAVSGIGSLQADPKAGRPILINSMISDKVTSMTAAQAIAAALFARERTGLGQRIDIAMLEASLFFLWPDNMQNFTFVDHEVPFSFRHSHAIMVQQTSDGYLCAMPAQVDEWLGVFRALELEDLTEDPKYRTADGLNLVLLYARLGEACVRFTTTELAQRLEANQVPFAVINARDEILDDPQVVAMESIWEFDHPFAGPMRQPRPPARFSATPAGIFRCSPELGEHTREVLEAAGFSDEAIGDLKARGIVR